MQKPNELFNTASFGYVFSIDAEYLDHGDEPLIMREIIRSTFGVIPANYMLSFGILPIRYVFPYELEQGFVDYPMVSRTISREWDLIALKLYGMLNEVE